MNGLRVDAVLFDLDGTLVDSAPDLAATANAMRVARGLDPMPFEALRPMVGAGARGMVGTAFGVMPDDDRFGALRDEFLERYAEGLLDRTCVFASMRPVIDRLDLASLPWGIVTNKLTRFTEPVVSGLKLKAAVLICGDTTPHAKPHPEPLFEAARRLKLDPAQCAYVGDDMRDVLAGRSAGMATAIAAWGYLGTAAALDTWGADAVFEEPSQLLKWLGLP